MTWLIGLWIVLGVAATLLVYLAVLAMALEEGNEVLRKKVEALEAVNGHLQRENRRLRHRLPHHDEEGW